MRILFFVLFFFPQALWAVDEPAGCWQKAKEFPCAFRATKSEWVERSGLKMYLGKGASVLISGAKEWQILSGKVWVEKAKGWTLSQLGREFQVEGEAWLEKQPEKLFVQHFHGQTRVKGRTTSLVVPEGFENWWTLAGEGIIQPMLSTVLTDWNRWARWPKAKAEKRIREYSLLWKDSVEQSADLYQAILERRMASIEERENSKHRRQQQSLQERDRLRKMFRARYENR